MRVISEIRTNPHLQIKEEHEKDEKWTLFAYLIKPYRPGQAQILFSRAHGWEHASISMKQRNPTWDEMCLLKDIFWNDEEIVIQYHPPKSQYVNDHLHCLHLWKKIDSEFELPPNFLV